MSDKIELDAMAFVRLRMARLDVLREMRELQCEGEERPSDGYAGEPPCYLARGIDHDEWCPDCLQGEGLLIEAKALQRREQNTWRRLRRAMRKEATECPSSP